MPVQKYKQYYKLMQSNNEKLLQQFKKIHDGFASDPSSWEDQFHAVGRDVLDVMRDWERRLCSGTERGNYALYSVKLAEKYWNEIKHDFPLIEQVGLKTKKIE